MAHGYEYGTNYRGMVRLNGSLVTIFVFDQVNRTCLYLHLKRMKVETTIGHGLIRKDDAPGLIVSEFACSTVHRLCRRLRNLVFLR
jgi:hypothetical protein